MCDITRLQSYCFVVSNAIQGRVLQIESNEVHPWPNKGVGTISTSLPETSSQITM